MLSGDCLYRTAKMEGASQFEPPSLLAIVAVLSVAAIGTALAQNPAPSGILTSLTSDRPELTVGAPVTLTLGVMHAHDQAVVLPGIGPEWGPFEVLSHTTAQTISNGDGTKTTFRQFRVTLFATGEFETPDLPIAIRRPDGIVEEVFPTPLRLTVKSVLTGPDEQLKDIRSPADLSTPFWERPAIIAMGALAALVALGSGGFFFLPPFPPQRGVSGTIGRHPTALGSRASGTGPHRRTGLTGEGRSQRTLHPSSPKPFAPISGRPT